MTSQPYTKRPPVSQPNQNDSLEKTDRKNITTVDEVERLLDEALDETFPASDPISSMRFTPDN